MTPAVTVEPHDSKRPPAYFGEALNDTERLLKYAAEIGVEIDADTRAAVLHARSAYTHGGWDDHIGADLLMALTHLAARLKPVTAESLKAYHAETRPTVRTYFVWALVIAIIILPVSIATFVTSSISNTIRDDITKANGLAVKLRAELGAPPAHVDLTQPWTPPPGVSNTDVISDLVEYAATVRSINARAVKLNKFIIPRQKSPFENKSPEQLKEIFELPVGLVNPVDARDKITATYQDVRNFALVLITDVTVFYGAISSCILPVLYALLGTCAYLIRTFEDQMSSRTFTPSAANSARFLIAGIGGLVIGLFNNVTITQQASLPPLGLAFLVGYAVDVFFTFLEGLIRVFTRTPQAAPLPPAPPTRSPASPQKPPQPAPTS
jgi:hypothetical protein